MTTTSLTPILQKEITFYEDELAAVKDADGDIYISVRHLCQALGIDTQGQTQRIQRHSVLEKGFKVCNLHTIKGDRRGYVLRVDLMPLWLAGIRAKSVREEIRPKIERFQVEAGRVLWQAFQTGELSPDIDFETLLQQDSPSAQAYKMARAVMTMARQQLVLEGRIASAENQLGNHENRIEQIEATLGDSDRFIDTAQASRISQAVKAISIELGKRSGRNEFGGVYGELYRRFEIAGYRELPSQRFGEAMQFLSEWHQSLSDGDVPF